MGRRAAWALLIVAIATMAVVAWLGRRGQGQAAPQQTPSLPGATSNAPSPSPSGSGLAGWQVRWVIDGDTLDVRRGSERMRLRLVNINAPEVAHNSVPDECLGPQARDRLRALLPVGTAVELQTFGKDRFGRVVAIARKGTGDPVNLTLVQEGLAAPLVVGDTIPLASAARAAQAQASQAHLGLHSPSVACTLPARVTALERDAKAAAKAANKGAAALEARARALLAEIAARPAPPLVAALTEGDLAKLTTRLTDLSRRVTAGT